MRQDASTLERQALSPTDAGTFKIIHGIADISRACDAWLARRLPNAPKYKFNGHRVADDAPVPQPKKKSK